MITSKALESAIRQDLSNALKTVFDKFKVLTITTNWEVHDKTYGEVGGRFLEDFLLAELKANLADIRQFHIVGAGAPQGRRTMEDVIAEWQWFHNEDTGNWRLSFERLGRKTS